MNSKFCGNSPTKTIATAWIEDFLKKKVEKNLQNQKKAVPLQSHLEKCLGRNGIFEQAERGKTWFYAEAKLKMPTFRKKAEIAQLVEHNLAKVGVAGPSPVFRSKNINGAAMVELVDTRDLKSLGQ